MGLIVQAFYREIKSSEIVFIDELPSYPNNDLFGPEAWRKSLWSSDEFKKLGCKILSSLREYDIYAESNHLMQLERELNSILELINDGVHKLNFEEYKGINFRVRNALEAIRIARKYKGGGVYIG